MTIKPWGTAPVTPPDLSVPPPAPPGRERAFNAPPVALILALSMPVLFGLQQQLPDGGLGWAFYPTELFAGRPWPGLVTSIFLHGGWSHVGFNAAMTLCFAPPVARMLTGGRGLALFAAFYLVGGVVAALGFALVNPSETAAMVGASGAISGLMGAALRLMGRPGWAGPSSMADRRALGMLGMLLALNLGIGLVGLAPGGAGMRIAWEAHVAGLVFGYLAVGPLFRLSRSRA